MPTDLFLSNQDPIWNVLIRFIVNLVVLFIVVRLIYYKYSKKEEYLFTFFLMGIMIFLVCILLKNVEIQLGMVLGLFAIFAILRFRSRNLSFKNMSYFFTVIGISVINSMANFYHPVRGTILINAIIILSVYILEIYYNKKALSKHILIYDKLELLAPDLIQELLADLSQRTRKSIVKVKIEKIDLIKNTAELEVFYSEKSKSENPDRSDNI